MTTRTTRIDTGVLIVGAGPVGLTLAIDLAWRGIDVTIVEARRHDEPPSVKCNHVSARTMEIFRRVGLASRVRAAGLPSDFPNDVSYRTTVTGIELARIPIPCRRERYTATAGPDTWWPTPEPPHRINQVYLEPILLEHAGAMDGLRILSGTRVVDFDERRDDVVARAVNVAGAMALLDRRRALDPAWHSGVVPLDRTPRGRVLVDGARARDVGAADHS
jgi:2-polyprenyl-6-methoxyphenol hydroxylase-like FAD-dependent oxidoreductase